MLSILIAAAAVVGTVTLILGLEEGVNRFVQRRDSARRMMAETKMAMPPKSLYRLEHDEVDAVSPWWRG